MIIESPNTDASFIELDFAVQIILAVQVIAVSRPIQFDGELGVLAIKIDYPLS